MPLGGKLKLKGLPVKGEKKKKKRQREEYEESKTNVGSTENEEDSGAAAAIGGGEKLEPDDGLTESQRRHQAKMREREKQNIKKMLSKSHRERIDEFNMYLSNLTEHNDIPRVSAAGNG